MTLMMPSSAPGCPWSLPVIASASSWKTGFRRLICQRRLGVAGSRALLRDVSKVLDEDADSLQWPAFRCTSNRSSMPVDDRIGLS